MELSEESFPRHPLKDFQSEARSDHSVLRIFYTQIKNAKEQNVSFALSLKNSLEKGYGERTFLERFFPGRIPSLTYTSEAYRRAP